MSEKFPIRKSPARGIDVSWDDSVIVFLTVCTKDRVPWLAREACHELLREVWAESRAWNVGRYVIMPDHIHFFATPGETDVEIEAWIAYWKSQFTKRHGTADHRWQRSFWDRRLRSEVSYEQKWVYVRDNPVRHGLARQWEDWPYQGELLELRW